MENNDETPEMTAEQEIEDNLLDTDRELLQKFDKSVQILQEIIKKIKRLEKIDEEIKKLERHNVKIEGSSKINEDIMTLQDAYKKTITDNEEKTPPVVGKGTEQKVISKIEKLESKINAKKSTLKTIKSIKATIKGLGKIIEHVGEHKKEIFAKAYMRKELRELYDAKTEANEIERIINALFKDTQKYTLGNSKVYAFQVVFKWLLEIPQKQGEEQRVYNKAIKYLLNRVASTDQDIRESAMAHILAALGNCTTPIEALIEQTIEQMRQEGIQVFETPEQQHQFEAGRVIEKVAREVLSKSKYTGGPEDIEIVQALRNGLLLNGAKDNKSNTALKVTGSPFYLPSKTENIVLGFRLLKKRKDLTEAFAKRFCETNEQDQLLKDENGCYKFDHNKLKNEIEKQKAEKHGILSPVYEELEQFKEQLNTCLEKEFDALVSEHFDNTTVTAYSDVYKQAKALEKRLRKVAPDQYKTEAEQFLNQIKQELGELQKQLSKKDSNLSRLTKPMNATTTPKIIKTKSKSDIKRERKPSNPKL